MTAFDIAFETIQKLAQNFQQNYHHYMNAAYSEADARKDFIDKFFVALGWDVNHETQTNPYEQEVKIERGQKQQNETARKRADYAFFTAPNYKNEVFFVEAKKPSVLIQNNPQHYFQTIRYGWNAGCPISILTDFEEFVIIDCRNKPDIKYALNGKHKSYRFTDYLNKEKFAEIYWLFSREAVVKNSITTYAENLPKTTGKIVQKALFKGGYQAIDDSFLAYIDSIRENLAKAFKKNNESLSSEQLTEAVQRTVDRLVFIRFLEDKFIEAEEHVNEWKGWKDFVADCRKLDAKYNGVVFKKHFIDEQHFAGAEEKLFHEICQDISSLNSPYDFNYFPIHILGSIYERFLGKVVVATAKRVHIDEKPEVRKAGGVYYTPKYIVDYIVQNTVGKIIDGLTPKQIAEKTFADIACGSGSFLIGVYECLLDYHKKYYTTKLTNKTELDKRSEDYTNVEYKDGVWRLTLKLKQEILLNNIYGVDIDAQAVEVTQLSLFLKMLEDESLATTQVRQGSMFSKVLPNLSNNIICGNSLIGWDIMQGQLFEDDELKKLNPMDFETAFPKIIKAGGFDAIVGNPPYVDYRMFNPNEVKYYKSRYYSAQTKEKYSLYIPFVEKAISTLNKKGLFGYIIPNTFLATKMGLKLREYLIHQNSIIEINDVSKLKVFGNVGTYPVLLFCSSNIGTNKIRVIYSDNKTNFINPSHNYIDLKVIISQQDLILSTSYNSSILNLINKISSTGSYLKNLQEIFVWGTSISGFKSFKISENKYKELNNKKRNEYAKVVQTADIKRYLIDWQMEYIQKQIYSLKSISIFNHEEKIVIARLTKRLQATIDNEKAFVGKSSILFCKGINNRFLLGILNSKVLNFYYSKKFENTHMAGGYLRFDIPYLQQLPIPKIDFSNKTQKQQHDNLVNLVEQMLAAKQQQAKATTDKDKNFIANKIQSIDTQIDHVVYQLYNLTPQEIELVAAS